MTTVKLCLTGVIVGRALGIVTGTYATVSVVRIAPVSLSTADAMSRRMTVFRG
jgi:hypothetical protein